MVDSLNWTNCNSGKFIHQLVYFINFFAFPFLETISIPSTNTTSTDWGSMKLWLRNDWYHSISKYFSRSRLVTKWEGSSCLGYNTQWFFILGSTIFVVSFSLRQVDAIIRQLIFPTQRTSSHRHENKNLFYYTIVKLTYYRTVFWILLEN